MHIQVQPRVEFHLFLMRLINILRPISKSACRRAIGDDGLPNLKQYYDKTETYQVLKFYSYPLQSNKKIDGQMEIWFIKNIQVA